MVRLVALPPGEHGLPPDKEAVRIADQSPSAETADPAKAAFLDFCVYEQPFVKRFLMRLGASHEAAEDAVRDAVVDAWILFSEGRWQDIRNPRGWIRDIARKRYLRPPGARRRQPQTVLVGDIPEILERAADLADPAELTIGTMRVGGVPRPV